MSSVKNKANSNMARSKKVCVRAAKARWARYYEQKELLSSAIAAGFCKTAQ